MEKISKFLKKISQENDYYYFTYEKTGEIWISGYRNGIKFDLVVKPVKKHQVKKNKAKKHSQNKKKKAVEHRKNDTDKSKKHRQVEKKKANEHRKNKKKKAIKHRQVEKKKAKNRHEGHDGGSHDDNASSED